MQQTQHFSEYLCCCGNDFDNKKNLSICLFGSYMVKQHKKVKNMILNSGVVFMWGAWLLKYDIRRQKQINKTQKESKYIS